MKRTITLIGAYLLSMILVACGNNSVSATDEGATSMPQTESKTDESNNIVSEESNLHAYVSDGRWLDGIRFEAGASDDELENWISSIGLTPALNEDRRIYRYSDLRRK